MPEKKNLPACPLCGIKDHTELSEDYGPTGETIYACQDCGTAWAYEAETGEQYLVGG